MKRNRLPCAIVSLLLLLPIGRIRAEEVDTIRIAFIDSGISVKHLDGDRVENGHNFVFPERDTSDRIGHGTATAGMVLGSNELGLHGSCSAATLVPLVCYDAYPMGVVVRGNAESMATAIRAAVDEYDCTILNISMGISYDDPTLREAVEYAQSKGALLVSAVGNDNLTAAEKVYYPAAYEKVIGVGASDCNRAANFSQRNAVDVLAQGTDLATVTNRNAAKSETRSGTSYACAYVSGLCATIWQTLPNLTAEEVCDILFSSAIDVEESGFDANSGWGLVSEESVTEILAKYQSPPPHWATESIRYCVDNGWLRLDDGEVFDPDEPLTEADLIEVFRRLSDSTESDLRDAFSDLAPHTEETFENDRIVTREEVVTVLYRFTETAVADRAYDDKEHLDFSCFSYFSDGESVSPYAKEAVRWALSRKILLGSDNKILPKNACTTAHLAAFLHRWATEGVLAELKIG